MEADASGESVGASQDRAWAAEAGPPAEVFVKLADLLPVPVYILDAGLNVVYCNAETRSFGSGDDDLGVNLDGFSPDIQKLLGPTVERCLATGQACHAEGWVTSHVRGECYLLVDCIPLSERLAGCVIIDRTVREHAEAALAQADEQVYESEWRFQKLIEAMAECVLLTDGDGTIQFANRAAESLTGCQAGELVGRRLDEFVDAGQRKSLKQQRQLRGQGESGSYELLIQTPHLGLRSLQLWESPRYTRQGDFCGAFVVAQDVSDSKRSQLVQSVLLNISAATGKSSNLGELVSEIHRELGKLINVSNFFVALYDERNSRFYFPFYVDERDEDFHSQPMPRSLTEYVLRTGEPLLADEQQQQRMIEQGEIEVVGPTCSVWLGVPLKTPRGTLGVVVVQDYHEPKAYEQSDLQLLSFVSGYIALEIERKQAESVLQVSEERYRHLVESMTEGICSLNPDGVFEFANPSLERIFGVESGGLLGRFLTDFVSGDQDHVAEEQLALRRQGRASTYELQITRPDGEKRDLLVSATPRVSEEGTILDSATLVQDITIQKTAEQEQERLRQQMLEAQKMESLGRLAGGISHDFNNILLAILGNIELARVELPPSSPIQRNLEEVVSAVTRAKELVQQVLTLSRRSEPRQETVFLNEIVDEVIRLIRAGIPPTVEIRHINTASPDVILADPAQIHQLLMNLCTNAAQAMEGRGGLMEIQVAEEPVPMRALREYPLAESRNFLALRVSDTGIGIGREIMPMIFEPFFTTKRVGIGTGLGLAVVRGIVTSHNGAITVDSQAGQGTVFTVYLPKAKEFEMPPAKRQEQPQSGSGRILFVDDDEAPLNVGRRMLIHLGYETVATNNSQQALELFKQAPQDFSAVITDLTMPGLNGLELAEAINAIRPDIPIILCTGFDPRLDAETTRARGICDCITKPYGLKDLGGALARALGV